MTINIRCPSCGWSDTITDDDVSDSHHTPRSKAARMQSRTGDTCPECGNESLAVSEQ